MPVTGTETQSRLYPSNTLNFRGFRALTTTRGRIWLSGERCSGLELTVLPPGAGENEHRKKQAKFTAQGFQLPHGLMKLEGKNTNFPLLTCMPPKRPYSR